MSGLPWISHFKSSGDSDNHNIIVGMHYRYYIWDMNNVVMVKLNVYSSIYNSIEYNNLRIMKIVCNDCSVFMLDEHGTVYAYNTGHDYPNKMIKNPDKINIICHAAYDIYANPCTEVEMAIMGFDGNITIYYPNGSSKIVTCGFEIKNLYFTDTYKIYLDIDNNLYVYCHRSVFILYKYENIKLVNVSNNHCMFVEYDNTIHYGVYTYDKIICDEEIYSIYNHNNHYYYTTQTGIYHFFPYKQPDGSRAVRVIKIAESSEYVFTNGSYETTVHIKSANKK